MNMHVPGCPLPITDADLRFPDGTEYSLSRAVARAKSAHRKMPAVFRASPPVAAAPLVGVAIWFADANHIIDEYLGKTPPGHSLCMIIKNVVGTRYDVTRLELEGDGRCKRVIIPRHIAVFLCKVINNWSFPKVGKSFGNRDHTSIMSTVRKIEAMIVNDPAFGAHVLELSALVNAESFVRVREHIATCVGISDQSRLTEAA